MQVAALVDCGATNTFINKSVIKSNNLVTKKLAQPCKVYNVDGTENKDGRITHIVERGYLEVGLHKSRENFFITDLGTKEMILGMDYLRHHNPEINWDKGELKFTRCPQNCTTGARKTKVSREEVDELGIQEPNEWDSSLEDLGGEDPFNPYINWMDIESKEDRQIAYRIAAITEKDGQDFDEDEEDTVDWKSKVPKHLWEYGEVFSKQKSERMPTRKPYDHGIDFFEEATLPKPSKLYPMSPLEKNSLDEWIQEELRKGYIRKSKSPLAAPVFFIKKKDGSL